MRTEVKDYMLGIAFTYCLFFCRTKTKTRELLPFSIFPSTFLRISSDIIRMCDVRHSSYTLNTTLFCFWFVYHVHKTYYHAQCTNNKFTEKLFVSLPLNIYLDICQAQTVSTLTGFL